MDKEKLVTKMAEQLRINAKEAENIVNLTIAEIVSPFVLKRPGSEVGLLDNSCKNNCKGLQLEEIEQRNR